MGDLYCLTNLIDYSSAILAPIKFGSNRIKYTCFGISQRYLIFGASSGSLYLFNRSGKFLHLIPNKQGAVTHLAISENEKYVAFATKAAHAAFICVYAINLSPQMATPQVIYTHLGNNRQIEVTCIHWTRDEKQFYYGDSCGQVNFVVLSSFIGHSLLNMTAHPILFLESPIVQIDDFESLLLVSNHSKCILCNTEYEEYKQIGNKPRDGMFGACFALSANESTNASRIYCARPGTRFWEADFEGDVILTHQFKTALARPPSKICKLPFSDEAEEQHNTKYEENDEILDYQPQNLRFGKIQMLSQDFLLAFTELGLYIFDIRSSAVILWCNQFERIVDCCVLNEDILIFTQTGSLYSVQLMTIQAHACTLVQQEQMYECACLMRKNVKYFADKARDNYSLHVLNNVKNFLIDRQEYELLNDVSVIFDAVAQCEGNGDNNSSGGSTGTTEHDHSGSLGATGGLLVTNDNQKLKGVYVLENSFCENLKPQRGNENNFRDALLTVTGKFGKNIIKYKFNIMGEEQKKLVEELIPTERSIPFKDVKALYEGNSDEDIVCRVPRKMTNAGNKQKNAAAPQQHISTEEKTIYNLYLICKSAKFSNTNLVDRYRTVFDEYSSHELLKLLQKLEQVMQDHGDSPTQAKKNIFDMYFNYLNPELIWEVDDEIRDFISNGFILINESANMLRCDNCNFPLRFENSCQFHELGAALLRYYWSRNEQVKCYDVLTHVPAMLDSLAKFYMSDVSNNLEKVLPIVLNYGHPQLLLECGRNFNSDAWRRCFDLFAELQQGRLPCANCQCLTEVQDVNNSHFFYSWSCFLNITLDYMDTHEILGMILKWSNYIPCDAIDREFYTRCLLKSGNLLQCNH